MSSNTKLYDKRVIRRNLQQRIISPEDLENHLGQLPDNEGNYDFVMLDQEEKFEETPAEQPAVPSSSFGGVPFGGFSQSERGQSVATSGGLSQPNTDAGVFSHQEPSSVFLHSDSVPSEAEADSQPSEQFRNFETATKEEGTKDADAEDADDDADTDLPPSRGPFV